MSPSCRSLSQSARSGHLEYWPTTPRWIASTSVRVGRIALLHQYSDHIARVALVGAKPWEEVVSTFIGGTVLFAAATHYFHPSEIQQAWFWVKTAKHANDIPVRAIYQGGIWRDYQEEFNL